MSQAQSQGRARASSQPLGNTSARLIAVHIKSANKNIFKALLSLASANLLVRVMGLGMQVVVTASYGVSTDTDAYNALYLLITTMAQLIISGMETAVIPIYTRIRVRGREEVSRLFSTLLNCLIITLLLCTGILYIFRSQIAIIAAPGASQDILTIAINIAPFMLPVLAIMTLIGFMESLLNAEGQYGWPAYAGVLVPLSTAVVVLLGRFLPFAKEDHGILLLCIGNLIGLTLNLCAVVIRAHMAKFSYTFAFDLNNPDVRAIAALLLVPMFSALASQLAPLLDQVFASALDAGTITALGYANKITSVFTGVIFASVGKAALPYFASQAAIKDWTAFKGTLRLYLWAVGIATIILSLGLLIFARPVVFIMFQRGKFDPGATEYVALLLVGLTLGLPQMAMAFLTSQALTAMKKARILMASTLNFVLFNAILDYVFSLLWGAFGIALATSIAYSINMIFLFIMLRITIGKLNLFTPPPELLKIVSRLGIMTWMEDNLAPLGFTYAMRKGIVRAFAGLAVFGAGAVATVQNGLFTLRVAFGSIVLLALFRYPYLLVLAWIALDALIGATAPLVAVFQGGNLLSGLALPTLLLMFTMPVKKIFKRMPQLAFMFALLMWIFFTIGFSEIGIQQFLTLWIVYVCFVAVGVLTVQMGDTKQRLYWIIDAILVQATFISLYGIYGWFFQVDGVYDTNVSTLFRTGSFYSDPPTLAFVLSVIFPVAIYRVVTIKNFWGRIAILGCLASMLGAFLLTFSRGPSVSLVVSLFLLIFFLPSRNLRITLLGSTAILGAIGAMAAVFLDIPIIQRFFNNDLTTLNGRTLLWQALLDNFNPYHLLGEGLQASDVLLNKLQVGQGGGVIATAPHNLFLGTLYDDGLIGEALLVLLLATIAWTLLRKMFKGSVEHRLLSAAVFAAFINIFIQSFELTAFWMQSIGIYIWIIMALPFALCWDNEPRVIEEDEEVSEVETMHLEAIQLEKEELLAHTG